MNGPAAAAVARSHWATIGTALSALAVVAGIRLLHWLLWWLDADDSGLAAMLSLATAGLCLWLAFALFRDAARQPAPWKVVQNAAAASTVVRAALVLLMAAQMLTPLPLPGAVYRGLFWLGKLNVLVFFGASYAVLIRRSTWRNRTPLHLALATLLLILLVLPIVAPVSDVGFLRSTMLSSAWMVLDMALYGAWRIANKWPAKPAPAAPFAKPPGQR